MIYQFDKSTLTYKNITPYIIIGAVSLMGLTACLTILNADKVKYISQETRAIIIREQNEFSKDKLKEYILELNIRYPHIVLAQAQIETGHFTSPIFKENNNLFGMKVAKKRPTTNKGEEKGHAYYDTWKESVVDYAFYSAQYLSDIKTEKEYLQYLRQNYAKDTSYVPKIIKQMKLNLQNQN
jgi:flagellum-specific peptidoglycan hydrolase FlgJ